MGRRTRRFRLGAGAVSAIAFAGSIEAASLAAPEDMARSKLVHRYWINFARTGIPSAPGAPTWPDIGSRSEPVMVFADAGPRIALNFDRQRLDDVEKDESVNPCDPLFDVIRRKSAPCR